MQNICLQNIVTIRDICDPNSVVDNDKYDIFDAPEIDRINISNLANGENLKGIEYLKQIRFFILKDFENDLITALNSKKFATNIFGGDPICTGSVNLGATNNPIALERGITIHYAKVSKTSLRKIKVKNLKIYSKTTGTFNLKIYDQYNNSLTQIPITLTANAENTIAVDYTIVGEYARFLIDNTNLATNSTTITCFVGCNDTLPNDCGFVTGWNGSTDIKSEGFGITADFSCECDYSYMLCQIPKNYIGKLIWLKFRIEILERSLIGTSRLTNWIVYGKEDRIQLIKDLRKQYEDNWKLLIDGLGDYLQKFEAEGCIDCRKSRQVVNV
ncbi:MAG: hypothetical protein ACEQSR_03725 [Candidatus Methylacidiphilales bacterium]